MNEKEEQTSGGIIAALFLDLSFVFNVLLETAEFRINRVFIRDDQAKDTPRTEPEYRGITEVRLLLVVTALFAFYGPTLDAICSVAGKSWGGTMLQIAGVVAFLIGAFVAYRSFSATKKLVERRVSDIGELQQKGLRWFVFVAVSYVFSLVLPLVSGFVVLAVAWNTPGSEYFCYGAEPNWGAAMQLILAIAAVVLAYVYAAPKRAAQSTGLLPLVFFSTILALLVFVVWISGEGLPGSEAGYLPYLHVYPFILVLLFSISLFAKPFVEKILGDFVKEQKKLFSAQLKRTELFLGPPRLETLSRPRLFFGLLGAPFYHPFHLLLLPAFVALTAPTEWLLGLTLGSLFIGYLLLVWGGISSRWDRINFFVQRYFLQGLPLLISLFVIVLSLLRVFQLHYVSTLLDVAPFGAITMIVVMSYASLWLYDYYMNRPLQLKLMELLGAPTDKEGGDFEAKERIRYQLDSGNHCLHRLNINPNFRDLQTHSGTWFAAVGEIVPDQGETGEERETVPDKDAWDGGTICGQAAYVRKEGALWQLLVIFKCIGQSKDSLNAKREIGFRVWDMMDLMQRLANGGWCQGEDGKDVHPDQPEISAKVSYLNRRVRLYRLGMNAAAVIALGIAFCIVNVLNGEDKDPLVSAQFQSDATGDMGKFDLAKRLREQAEGKRPAILLAASGGGTRAALYTYSVLRGLEELNVLNDLVFASGVSGGGVALAYFASYYDKLNPRGGESGDNEEQDSWIAYRNTLASPFINDVLEGVLEIRTFWKTGWSELLEESFCRRFFDRSGRESKECRGPDEVLAGVGSKLGLVFNMAITGHPYDDARLTSNLFFENDQAAQGRYYSRMSGARLIVTNLSHGEAFPRIGDAANDTVGQDILLPYRIVQDGEVGLTQAGTLTANFPPVFPDAVVCLRSPECAAEDVCEKRYKVTDGGATDNRGLISLLYALRYALEQLEPDHIPDIHIVVADASAFGYDYSKKTRGLSTALSGSKEQVANGLIDELYKGVKAVSHDHFPSIHYLTMPTIFRSSGGLGTHWMMPESFSVSNPYDPAPDGMFSRELDIDKAQFFALLDSLYTDTCPGDTVETDICDWICKRVEGPECKSADGHAEEWRELKGALNKYSESRHHRSAETP